MIMELPITFKARFAEVDNGEFLVYRLFRYEDLIYELVYALKEKKCVYCEKDLEEKNSTLDHRYPRATGGISITDNLFVCCPKCNGKKGNLTHEEYMKSMELSSEKEKERYRKEIERHTEQILTKIGFKLPRKWIDFEKTKEIEYQTPWEIFRGKKYHRIVEFYERYSKLPRPIVVDKNNFLLDGYNTILFSEDFGIEDVPVIRLENTRYVRNQEL